jgi:hypothetical protein
MRTPIIFAVCGVVLAGGSFFAGILVERRFLASPALAPKPDSSPAPQSGANNLQVRRSAFLEYIVGKPIALRDPRNTTDRSPVVHTVRKGDVEITQFGSTANQFGNDPWRTEVTFILNTGKERYAVHCDVSYREIDDSVAFVGLDVREVARQ